MQIQIAFSFWRVEKNVSGIYSILCIEMDPRKKWFAIIIKNVL
jgi:hypothetical protein